MTEPIIGIDLGTTNSLVAIADERGPRVLAPSGVSPLVPSVVRFEAGGVVVGDDARARAVEFPYTTVGSVKRLMGRSLADAAADLPYLSYQVVSGEHDTARVAIPAGEDGAGELRIVSPQEVSALILRELRARAERVLGEAVSRAVVTVPAYFDDAQRQATRDAGRLAGLDVVRIVNEPTAAALAYGLGTARESERNTGTRHVVVYDLGGGTFDVSVLRLTPGDDTSFFQVLSTAGDTHLGGDDIDFALVKLFFEEMREQWGGAGAAGETPVPQGEGGGGAKGGTPIPQDLEGLPASTRRALAAFAQAVKHKLSNETAAAVRIDLGDGRVYERTVMRDELEAMMAPWVDRTIVSCERALRDAKRGLAGAAIDAVVLVGGSTRIPLVRRRVADVFGVEPYTALDPDLVVALGAAVQGSILSGAQSGALLLDVIPLSLGIETRGGAAAKLIMRNSPVPARATEMFSTSVDGQTSIKLNVVQGEREMAEDCRSLGEFHLKGLPAMPAGIPQLEVEFLVDANGVLNVGAHEKRSGKRAGLQIIPNHGLTSEEVDRIEAESFAHAREDMTRHRVVDLVVNSRLDLKWIGERLERYGGKLEPAYRDELAGLAERLTEMVKAGDADWQAVDSDAFARLKQELDTKSIRLQEIGIAESLKER
ncbi:MAG: Hsp70 family protein [Phycisphaeraceae bacterium]|nr:MAG: Hsp70 family protein [Phycisphaeraceae bacterium]